MARALYGHSGRSLLCLVSRRVPFRRASLRLCCSRVFPESSSQLRTKLRARGRKAEGTLRSAQPRPARAIWQGESDSVHPYSSTYHIPLPTRDSMQATPSLEALARLCAKVVRALAKALRALKSPHALLKRSAPRVAPWRQRPEHSSATTPPQTRPCREMEEPPNPLNRPTKVPSPPVAPPRLTDADWRSK